MKKATLTSKSTQLTTSIKIMLLACLFTHIQSSAQTTTFFNDACDNATGWTLGSMPPYTIGHGEYTAWRIGNTGTYVIDGNYLGINTWNKVTGSNVWTNEYLKTYGAQDMIAQKQVDARNYQTLELQFDWICNGEYGVSASYDYGQVGYSTNGGASFTWFTTGGPGASGRYYGSTAINRAQKITLPAALNNTQFIIGFRWINDDGAGSDPGFIVDNIKVSGLPTTPTSTVTFFTDDCSAATGWTLGAMPPYTIGHGEYTAWRIGNTGTYVIDGSYLGINTWNKVTGSNVWTNEYLKTYGAQDMIAQKQVDARNYQTLELQFDWICNGEYGTNASYDYGQVGYSTNGGTSFTWLTTGGPGGSGRYYGSTAINRAQKITLPAALNNTQFIIGFRWINDDGAGNDPGFIVDNIKVSGQSASGNTTLGPKSAFFSDNLKTDTDWILESGAVTQTGGEYTAWKIGGDSLCNLDSGALAISHWKSTTRAWSCGYFGSSAIDLKAYKKIDARNYEGLELQFDWSCKGEINGATVLDYGQVGYSLDGGSSFTWITSGGNNATGKYYGSTVIVRGQTIILPTTLNAKEFLLAFRWINNASIEQPQSFVVDNIKVFGQNIGTQLSAVFKDNFDSKVSWQLKKANTDPAGNTLAWNIDNRCSMDGNSLSIKLYNAVSKDWICGFATNAAADIIAYRTVSTNNASNLFVKMDWKVTSTSASDYGQIGYSLDGGNTFTWLTSGGINNTGKYYNQPTLARAALVKLPALLEGKNFQLAFRWINDGSTNTGQAMMVDNLSIIGIPSRTTAVLSDVEIKKISRITEEIVQVPAKKTDADVDALNETGKLTEKKYTDGLGRLIQNVFVKATPSKNDIVEPTLYDENGNSGFKILPYKSQTTDGGYHADMLKEQSAYYAATPLLQPNFSVTEYPFSQTVTDNSPLNRVTERGSVGKEFQPDPASTATSRTITQKQLATIDNTSMTAWEAVKAISFYPGTTDLTVNYYSAANGFDNLFVTEIKDEDKRITRTYTDTKGKKILVRKYAIDGTTILTQTYYVYDNLDRLRLIMQPEGVALITAIPQSLSPSIKDYCFEYNYDERGRVIAKKLPGGGWTEMAYDRWDRPAVTQDENQRAKVPQEFTFIKYDVLNRPIISGTFTPVNRSLTISAVRTELANTALGARFETRTLGTLPNMDYTNTLTYPMANATNALELLAMTYYDDMNYTDIAGFTFTPYLGYTAGSVVKNVRGLATAAKTKVLGSTNTWLITVNFYDQYDRVIQVQKQSINGVKNFITSTYDFLGRPLSTVEDNKLTASVGVVLKTSSQYDHMGRLTRTSHQTNGLNEVILADYKYSDLGDNVKEKNMHSTNGGASYLQSVDYTYNEKGWLTHINNADLSNDGTFNDDANDLFGLDLVYYKDQQIDGTKALYNSNVSEQVWKNKYENKKKGYLYTYDDLNRLTSASYFVNGGNWTSHAENGQFSLTGITYDGNGNIQTLQQKGLLSGSTTFGTIDNLSYTYNSNQLVTVTDAVGTTSYPSDFENGANSGDDYTYDGNGNLTADLNKNITSITYNLLNLPVQVTFGTGKKIVYTYDAIGTKLRKQLYTGTTLTGTTDYWGSAQYLNTALEFASTPEGRTFLNAGTFRYDYFIKDQVGNVRLSFYADASGVVQIGQVNDYYPMGNSFVNYTTSTPPKNYYTFNGMEFQQDNNLNTFDFHARMYDPQIGRTFQPDPLADQFLALSPYSFLNNNPINFMDPTGMKWIDKFYEGNGGGGGWNSMGGGFNGVTYGGANLKPNPMNAMGGNTYTVSNVNTGYSFDASTGAYQLNGRNVSWDAVKNYIENSPNWHYERNDIDKTHVDISIVVDLEQFENGYELADAFGQMLNAGGVIWGGSEIALQALRQSDGAQAIGEALGFGTQQTANALRGTLSIVSRVGKTLGVAGYGLSALSIGYKEVNGQHISTAEKVSFGVGTLFIGAGVILAGTAAAPFVAGAGLIYGAFELSSYMFTNQTVEEHIFGK